MAEQSKACPSVQPLLRGYLLGALSAAEMQRVAAHLERCAGCTAAVVVEKAALSVLDCLPATAPPEGLTARTLRRVQKSTDEKQALNKPRFQFGLIPLVTMVMVVGIMAAIWLPALARSRESARRSSCQNNLKQMGLVFKMYTMENRGVYPPMVSVDGRQAPDLHAIYPEYLTDPTVLICPSSPTMSTDLEALREALKKTPPDWDAAHRIVARQYFYFGWAQIDAADWETVQKHVAMEPPCADIKDEENTVYWLREGVEQTVAGVHKDEKPATRLQSEIPVFMDNPDGGNHVPAGANVLYLDGHVAFEKASRIPASPKETRVVHKVFEKYFRWK